MNKDKREPIVFTILKSSRSLLFICPLCLLCDSYILKLYINFTVPFHLILLYKKSVCKIEADI